MATFTAKLVLLAVALALLATYASAQCAIMNCDTCAMGNPNQCLVCVQGYALNANGACKRRSSSASLAPQSVAVAALVVLSAMLSYVL